jgi:hypothetical protein
MDLRMAGNKITISTLDEQGIDGLFHFRKRVLPQNSKQLDRKRWSWLFRQNPETMDNAIPAWVLQDGKEVVGSISSIPLKVKVGDSVSTCSFGSDYFVDKNYLGLPALRLLKAMQKQYTVNIGANLSPSATKLFKKMGYADLTDNIKNLTAFFPTNNSGVVPIQSTVKFYILKIIRLLLCRRKLVSMVTHTLPESAQLLWEGIERRLPVTVVKDRDYLKWRYEQCPSVEYRFVVLKRKQQIVALAVLALQSGNEGEKRGLIADILVDPNDFFVAIGIIKASLEFFEAEGCTSCFTHLLNDRMLRYFKLMGFSVSKSDLGLMVLLPKLNNEDLQDLINPGEWSFWIGDTDRY